MSYLVEKGVSVAQSCRLAGVPRSTYYHEPGPRGQRPLNPVLRQAVLDIALERPSFGYRRTTAMVRRRLRRPVNEKAVRRILKAERLLLPPCVVERTRVRKHPGRQITGRPDEAWQMDMKYVWCGRDGWAFMHNVVECCTSEWLGYVFRKTAGTHDACELLDHVVQERFPAACLAPGTVLRIDNMPVYASGRFREHARLLGLRTEHIQKQTPEDNGVVESFHARLERDYLRTLVFDSFAEAEAYLAWAREDNNTIKPKQRLRWMTPSEYHEEVSVSAR